MADGNEIFELEYRNSKISVEELNLPGQVLFRILFTDGTRAITILRARNIEQVKFWTSMPEGRQKLAEEIGPLIEQYYLSQRK